MHRYKRDLSDGIQSALFMMSPTYTPIHRRMEK